MKRSVKVIITLATLGVGLCASAMAFAADKYVIDFESRYGYAMNSSGAPTAKEGLVIAGTKSFNCDSTKSEQEWNEKLYSDTTKIVFKPGGSYTVDFDYKITSPEEDGYFYFLMRLKGTEWEGHDKGWTQWTSSDGDEGHKSISFDLDDMPNYMFIFGINKKGKISIDNVVVQEN